MTTRINFTMLILMSFLILLLALGSVFAQLQVKNSSQSVLLTITSNGDVGIGTTAPAAKLHNVGTVRFAGTLGIGTTADQLLLRNTSTGDVRPMAWPPGLPDGDNDVYVSAVGIGGTSTVKTITLTRSGTGSPAALTATWSDNAGTGADGVVSSATVSGTTTKSLTLARTAGLPTLTATWTDGGSDGVVTAAGFSNAANKVMTLTRSVGANVTGSFTDYHVTAAPVTGTATKTMTMSRNGLTAISSTWTDLDSYVSSATVSGTTTKSLTLARTGGLASLTATWTDGGSDGVVTAAGFSNAANKVMTLTRSVGANVTGTFADYHVTAAPVAGTSTKTMTFSRNGLTAISSTWTDLDNYVSSATVSGTTNKSLTLARTGGLASLTATWIDLGNLSGTGTATRVAFWSAANTLGSDANLFWSDANDRLDFGASGTAMVGLKANGTAGGNVGLTLYTLQADDAWDETSFTIAANSTASAGLKITTEPAGGSAVILESLGSPTIQVSDNLGVTGATTLSSTLGVTGATTLSTLGGSGEVYVWADNNGLLKKGLPSGNYNHRISHYTGIGAPNGAVIAFRGDGTISGGADNSFDGQDAVFDAKTHRYLWLLLSADCVDPVTVKLKLEWWNGSAWAILSGEQTFGPTGKTTVIWGPYDLSSIPYGSQIRIASKYDAGGGWAWIFAPIMGWWSENIGDTPQYKYTY